MGMVPHIAWKMTPAHSSIFGWVEHCKTETASRKNGVGLGCIWLEAAEKSSRVQCSTRRLVTIDFHMNHNYSINDESYRWYRLWVKNFTSQIILFQNRCFGYFTEILIKQSLEIWIHSHMASLSLVVWLWLEMVKSNHEIIYIRQGTPVLMEGRGLPADVDCLSG